METYALRRNVPLLFAVRACEYMGGFMAPIIVVFFTRRGLNITEVMLLETIFAVAIVAFEVPSGFFADRVGRRWSIFLGLTLTALAAVAYGLGRNFGHFAAAEVIWALGGSFVSGADSALLYDTLAAQGRPQEYQKLEGRANFIALGVAALASVGGGLIATLGLNLPFFATAGGLAVGAVLAFLLSEAPRQPGGHPRGELYYLYKIGRFALYKNKEVRWLIMLAALVTGMGTIGFWLYQPYFEVCRIPLAYFGAIFALFHLFAAFSGHVACAVEKAIGKAWALIILPVFLALSLGLMGAFVTPLGFLFVLGAQFVRGFSTPIVQDYINRHTWSDKRATVLSIKNLMGRILFVATAPLIGLAVDHSSVRVGLALAAAATFLGGGALIIALRKDRVI